MSMGNVLSPMMGSPLEVNPDPEPAIRSVTTTDVKPNRNVNRYKSLKRSGCATASAAASGRRACNPRRLSAFNRRQPSVNSARENRHI